VLSLCGQELARALVGLARQAVAEPAVVGIEPAAWVAHIRQAASAVAAPLGLILAGSAVGAFVAHQLQVRGLWVMGLIAPDPGRLWRPGRGSFSGGVERFAWSLVKTLVLGGVLGWAVWAEWSRLERISALEFPALALAASRAVIQPAMVLGVAMIALGLADLGFRQIRYEAMLRTTPEEQREDIRVMEGDASLRARRRRLASAWRTDVRADTTRPTGVNLEPTRRRAPLG
jgi:flagellar biosynthetic protein FlhB